MHVRVEEVVSRDEWQSAHGTMVGWNLRVTTENGEDFISMNTKPTNVVTPGQTFDFEPNGQMFGAFKKGKRAQQQGGSKPSLPAAGGKPAAAAAPRNVPTMSQAVAVLKECIDAVASLGGSDGHATTLFLARLRGDIRRDPTEADIAAAKAAEEAKAKAAAEAAAKAAAEAERQAALAAMPAPPDDDGSIPF